MGGRGLQGEEVQGPGSLRIALPAQFPRLFVGGGSKNIDVLPFVKSTSPH